MYAAANEREKAIEWHEQTFDDNERKRVHLMAYHMWPTKSLSASLLIARRTQILFVRRSIEFYTQSMHPQRVQDSSPARTPIGKMI